MGMPRPRPTLFEVRKSTNGKWRIVGFVNGVRKQFWFKTEKAVKQAVKDRNSEIVAHGTQATLDPVNRMRALNAIGRLSPFSKTIDDAVDHYVRYLKEHHASVPFSTLATQVREEFKRRLEKNEVSERHAESLEETLRSWKPALVIPSSVKFGRRTFANGFKAFPWQRRRRTSTRDTQIRFSILPWISDTQQSILSPG
jgi:hypothetical protein